MDSFRKLKSSLENQIQRVKSQQEGRFLSSAMSHISQMGDSYRQSDLANLGDLRLGSPEEPRSPSPEYSESSELQKAQEQIIKLQTQLNEVRFGSSGSPACREEISTPLFSNRRTECSVVR